MKGIFVIIITSLILLIPICAWSGTYYVSHGATGSWAGATNRSTPCPYWEMNPNVSPGDTVIFIKDGGIHDDDGYIINPKNSGLAGAPITFKGEVGTTVIIRSPGYGAQLAGKSYIIIENLTFQNGAGNSWISLRNSAGGTTSSYIIIQNCTFEATAYTWGGIYGSGNTHHIHILNNFIKGGVSTANGQGDAIYFIPTTGYSADHILIEGNDIEGGCHNAVEFQTGGGTVEHIVIRNNSIHNPNHTSLNIYGSAGTRPQYVLIENNRIYDGGSSCGVSSCPANTCGSSEDKSRPREQHPNLQFSGDYSIIRYNVMYNGGRGLDVENTFTYNTFYHNVLYMNVQGIYLNTANIVNGNVFVNNILKDNNLSGNVANYPVNVDSIPNSPCTNEWRANNIHDSYNIQYGACNANYGTKTLSYLEANIPLIWNNNKTFDPLFVNAAAYNFRLEPSSLVRDKGAALTKVAAGDSGSGTSLLVNDAQCFQNGKGIVQTDWIAVGSPNNIVQISSINYSTNTITLMNSMSRTVGDNVWLYKDSGGTIVLYGPAPDIGAYESPPPPTQLR